MGKPGFPILPPAGGSGRTKPLPGGGPALGGGFPAPTPPAPASPTRRFPGRTPPEVKTVRRILPPSQPPPAGGRSRVPSPGGGGSGRGPSPSLKRIAAGAGGWGNPVSLSPHPVGGSGRAKPSQEQSYFDPVRVRREPHGGLGSYTRASSRRRRLVSAGGLPVASSGNLPSAISNGHLTSSSSISNTRVAPGGTLPSPAPRSP